MSSCSWNGIFTGLEPWDQAWNQQGTEVGLSRGLETQPLSCPFASGALPRSDEHPEQNNPRIGHVPAPSFELQVPCEVQLSAMMEKANIAIMLMAHVSFSYVTISLASCQDQMR